MKKGKQFRVMSLLSVSVTGAPSDMFGYSYDKEMRLSIIKRVIMRIEFDINLIQRVPGKINIIR